MPIALLFLLLAAPPAQLRDISVRAAAARDADRPDEAIRLYRRGTVLSPPWKEGWWNLGTLLYDHNEFPGAQQAFGRFVKLEPASAAGLAFLGLCEFETAQYGNALDHLQRALRFGLPASEPLAKVTRYHAGLILTHAGQFESAVQLFGQLAVQGAGDRETVIATGIAGLRMAILPFELPADKTEFAFDVGHAMREGLARREAGAKREFEALLSSHPDAPELHNLQGQLLITSDPDGALAEWRREIEISPRHVPARLQIAFEYLKRGEAATGLPYAREAIAIDPKSFAAHNAVGRILMDAGDAAGAISELEMARNLAPKSPETRLALASAYAKAGRAKDAARERAEFLRLRNERDGAASP